MNALLLPEVLTAPPPADQPTLPLATEGAARVWQSAFGPILIEARDGNAFVNGQRVMPMVEARGSVRASSCDAVASIELEGERRRRQRA